MKIIDDNENIMKYEMKIKYDNKNIMKYDEMYFFINLYLYEKLII